MAEKIQEHTARVRDREGRLWQATTFGEQRADGTWSGWIEFRRVDPPAASAPPLRTGQETSQPKRRDLEYWASGIEPIYLDGAFQRALERSRGSDRGSAAPDLGPPAAG